MIRGFDRTFFEKWLDDIGLDEDVRESIRCELDARARLGTIEAERAKLNGELHVLDAEAAVLESTLNALAERRHERVMLSSEELTKLYNARTARLRDEAREQRERAPQKRKRKTSPAGDA